MVCMHCGGDTRVVNSRLQKRPNRVWRRRSCTGCGATFTSHEAADYNASLIVRDASGALQPFSRDKLLLSVFKSLQHRPSAVQDASALVDTILSRLLSQLQHTVIEDINIINTAYLVLLRFDKVAAVHYEAFHKPS